MLCLLFRCFWRGWFVERGISTGGGIERGARKFGVTLVTLFIEMSGDTRTAGWQFDRTACKYRLRARPRLNELANASNRVPRAPALIDSPKIMEWFLHSVVIHLVFARELDHCGVCCSFWASIKKLLVRGG